jgi:SAM-dependent methyltransferase
VVVWLIELNEAMDRAKVDAFLETFIGLAAGTTTIGLLAIADRTGLSSWLAANGVGSLDEISKGSGLDRRYLEEILSGLTAAGVLEHEEGVFTLPPEHALFLADEASPYFMGGWLDMLPAVIGQIDGIAEATRSGGGVPFEDFGPGMIRGLDRGNSPSQRVFLTRKWLPAVPGLVDRLNDGVRVADVGCGSGTAVIEIAGAYPNSDVYGFDLSDRSLELAQERSSHLPNAHFEKSGAEEIPVDPGFELVTTFDVIHDLTDPLAALRRIRSALRPGGLYLMMEPAATSDIEGNLTPRGALLYGISTLHCMTQSLAEGGLGLGAAWGREKAEALAGEAGFGAFDELEGISNSFSSFYLLQP